MLNQEGIAGSSTLLRNGLAIAVAYLFAPAKERGVGPPSDRDFARSLGSQWCRLSQAGRLRAQLVRPSQDARAVGCAQDKDIGRSHGEKTHGYHSWDIVEATFPFDRVSDLESMDV